MLAVRWSGAAIAKIVDLLLKNNLLAGDCARVKARLMYSWVEPKVAKDGVCVLLLEMWRFGVSLHGGQDRNDMSRRDRRSPLVPFSPLMKSAIRPDEETFFGGRGFSKGITDIRPKQEKVFSGGDDIEKT